VRAERDQHVERLGGVLALAIKSCSTRNITSIGADACGRARSPRCAARARSSRYLSGAQLADLRLVQALSFCPTPVTR